MKHKQYLIIAVLLTTLLLSACASNTGSSDEGYLGTIKERGKLVVGTSADYPPYESVDEAGEFVGYDMDLIREIGKRMGVEVEIKDMAFDALIAAVQEKKVDVVIAAMQSSPERDEKVDFTVPYHYQKDAFLVAADSTIVLNKALDAAGHSIGVQTGTIQEQWTLDNLVPAGTSEDQVFRYERVDQGALDVKAGRIDLLFINADPAAEIAAELGIKVALVTDETVIGGQSIALPEGEKQLQEELNRILGEMESDGSLRALLDTWGIP
jgi:polar amino acid transport system substrate-binding protein